MKNENLNNGERRRKRGKGKETEQGKGRKEGRWTGEKLRKGKQEEKDIVHRERRAINRNKKSRERKMQTELLELSWAWGKKIHENILTQKVSWHCPFSLPMPVSRTLKCIFAILLD